ncbi:hypothetical protein ANN_14642 [Periplaneta americana]|uniref:Uncharacterized protein n=1 Tax=Periplaneta americana TaxID=6978 RepID=A0ABQ8SYB7_PERAM|nr:hypothetical protein ANN_14642 [Periplaneta americana]
MSPGSSTESYPAFAHIGLRENPGKNLNQVTCPDRESNPGHPVSRPDVLTVTPQEMPFGRTLERQGTSKVYGVVQSKGATTHSYTITPVVSKAGKLMRKLLLIHQEPKVSFIRLQTKITATTVTTVAKTKFSCDPTRSQSRSYLVPVVANQTDQHDQSFGQGGIQKITNINTPERYTAVVLVTCEDSPPKAHAQVTEEVFPWKCGGEFQTQLFSYRLQLYPVMTAGCTLECSSPCVNNLIGFCNFHLVQIQINKVSLNLVHFILGRHAPGYRGGLENRWPDNPTHILVLE